MEKAEFSFFRKKLNKTQKQMSELLGTSLKAIHSYEQGWRRVPVSVERQLLFLASKARGNEKDQNACWSIKKCPPVIKKQCPAWEFNAGRECWFVNGTFCEGKVQKNWQEKMKICRSCEVFTPVLSPKNTKD